MSLLNFSEFRAYSPDFQCPPIPNQIVPCFHQRSTTVLTKPMRSLKSPRRRVLTWRERNTPRARAPGATFQARELVECFIIQIPHDRPKCPGQALPHQDIPAKWRRTRNNCGSDGNVMKCISLSESFQSAGLEDFADTRVSPTPPEVFDVLWLTSWSILEQFRLLIALEAIWEEYRRDGTAEPPWAASESYTWLDSKVRSSATRTSCNM